MKRGQGHISFTDFELSEIQTEKKGNLLKWHWSWEEAWMETFLEHSKEDGGLGRTGIGNGGHVTEHLWLHPRWFWNQKQLESYRGDLSQP